MREAVGSSWLFYLVITFLLVYVFFMGFIMNYASAYRAANYFVTQIETCQGQNDDCAGNNYEKIVSDIKTKYHYVAPNNQKSMCEYGNICVCCIYNGNSSVFRVILPVEFDVPFFGKAGIATVKAETKSIPNALCPGGYWDKTCE